jgi:hypothetical protein
MRERGERPSERANVRREEEDKVASGWDIQSFSFEKI